jgi:hypothetical protein
MQQMRPEERREFQRLNLVDPINGKLGSVDVAVLEIGILGSRLRHFKPLENEHPELTFAYQGRHIRLKCEVMRTTPQQDGDVTTYQSGVRFLAAMADSGDHLRDMLANLVGRELELRRATPYGQRSIVKIDGDNTVRGKDADFICFRFENNVWNRRRIFLPEQPSVGFTVANGQDGGEMQRLCRVFEASDEEGRRLIRLFAELSVSDLLQIPPMISS